MRLYDIQARGTSAQIASGSEERGFPFRVPASSSNGVNPSENICKRRRKRRGRTLTFSRAST